MSNVGFNRTCDENYTYTLDESQPRYVLRKSPSVATECYKIHCVW